MTEEMQVAWINVQPRWRWRNHFEGNSNCSLITDANSAVSKRGRARWRRPVGSQPPGLSAGGRRCPWQSLGLLWAPALTAFGMTPAGLFPPLPTGDRRRMGAARLLAPGPSPVGTITSFNPCRCSLGTGGFETTWGSLATDSRPRLCPGMFPKDSTLSGSGCF